VDRLFPAALALRRLKRHDQIGRGGEAHLVPFLVKKLALPRVDGQCQHVKIRGDAPLDHTAS